jgi:predicted Zn-dependent protease
LIELLMTTLLGGEDAKTLTAIGQIYLTAERLDDAERVLQRAVAADATDAQARYSLGATLIRLNRIPEGQRQLDEYRRLNDAKLKEHQRLLDKESNAAGVLR